MRACTLGLPTCLGSAVSPRGPLLAAAASSDTGGFTLRCEREGADDPLLSRSSHRSSTSTSTLLGIRIRSPAVPRTAPRGLAPRRTPPRRVQSRTRRWPELMTVPAPISTIIAADVIVIATVIAVAITASKPVALRSEMPLLGALLGPAAASLLSMPGAAPPRRFPPLPRAGRWEGRAGRSSSCRPGRSASCIGAPSGAASSSLSPSRSPHASRARRLLFLPLEGSFSRLALVGLAADHVRAQSVPVGAKGAIAPGSRERQQPFTMMFSNVSGCPPASRVSSPSRWIILPQER